MTAPCALPAVGLCFTQASDKRQLKRTPAPSSRYFFACCFCHASNAGGWWVSRSARPRAVLEYGLSAPPVPGTLHAGFDFLFGVKP
jgi:hypothetical protein